MNMISKVLWSRLVRSASASYIGLVVGAPAWAQTRWDPKPEVNLDDSIPEGFMLIEGDIIVPEDFFQTRTTYATNLWPGGVVPYQFDGNVDATNQQRMLDAMGEWEAVATVDFIPRAGHVNFVHIRSSTVNNSFVGMQGGSQDINIVSWTERFIICHELAHALGYWHEQSRADRNSYIQINMGNIQSGAANNFAIRPNQGPLGSREYGPYDYDSVMHYHRCAFSICCPPGSACNCPSACETITVLPPNQQWQNLIGQITHLSDMDQLTMSFLYPEGNWRFLDANYSGTQIGTFLQPYRQFSNGEANTPIGGTLWIQPGSYIAVGTWSRSMTLQAPLGGVTLGN